MSNVVKEEKHSVTENMNIFKVTKIFLLINKFFGQVFLNKKFLFI